ERCLAGTSGVGVRIPYGPYGAAWIEGLALDPCVRMAVMVPKVRPVRGPVVARSVRRRDYRETMADEPAHIPVPAAPPLPLLAHHRYAVENVTRLTVSLKYPEGHLPDVQTFENLEGIMPDPSWTDSGELDDLSRELARAEGERRRAQLETRDILRSILAGQSR